MSIGTAMKTMPLKDYLRLRGPAGGLFIERGEEAADLIKALEALVALADEAIYRKSAFVGLDSEKARAYLQAREAFRK
jgi:hypothetical protein